MRIIYIILLRSFLQRKLEKKEKKCFIPPQQQKSAPFFFFFLNNKTADIYGSWADLIVLHFIHLP